MDTLFEPAPPVLAETTAGAAFPVRRLFLLGRNYHAHVAEMGGTVSVDDLPFFTKWAEAVVPSGATLPYPPETEDWHYEVELVAALSQGGFRIAEAAALDHVWGYATGLDMTRRDLQARAKRAGAPWDWAKNGPGSAPLGPIRPVAQTGHPSAGAIRLRVNGETRQSGDLSQMIWSVARTIAYLSRFYRLEPGDLIFTGTPAGVGPCRPGDRLRGEIDGLAPLEALIG